jgi:hypothetical protein
MYGDAMGTSPAWLHYSVRVAAAVGVVLAAASCGAEANERTTAAEGTSSPSGDVPFSATSGPEELPTPAIPDSGPVATLKVGGAWSGRMTLDDPSKIKCTPMGGTLFDARTGDFSDFDSGGANPGSDFTVSVVAPDKAGTGAVSVEFVTADGLHVSASGTEESDSAEIHPAEAGDGVAFTSKTTATLQTGEVTPIVVAGTIRC